MHLSQSPLVVVLLSCACAHEAGRRPPPSSARETLEQHTWSATPEALAARLAVVAPWNANCTDAGCRRCLTPPQLHEPACLELVRGDGGTLITVPTARWVDEDELEPALAALEAVAHTPVPPRAVPVAPTMGPVVGLHFVSGGFESAPGVGGRVGWRWWTAPHLAVSGLVEYEHTFAPGLEQVRDGPGRLFDVQGFTVDRTVAFAFRVEFAKATPLPTLELGVPEVALGLHGAATVLFSGERSDFRRRELLQWPPAPGFRFGVGLSCGRPGTSWVPVYGELGVEGLFELGLFSLRTRAALGVGF